MIDKQNLKDFIEKRLEGTEYFPVDVTVSGDNVVRVEIDRKSTRLNSSHLA